MSPLLQTVVQVSMGAVFVSILFTLWRLLRGPSAPDRVLALDTLTINAIAFVILFGMQLGSDVFFEAALLLAMMGFVGTVSLSKHIAGRSVIQ
jgi:multicomponent K+:H+ antiporter subunit F